MGSICLSSASILRCDSLTRIQNIYLIVPTALEIIFSTSLVFIDRGPRKRNLLLMAEGLSFLTLVILELLSSVLPAVRGNLHLFEAFGLAIGIASLLPISLYTIFLYLLIITESANALPRRIKHVTILAPVFFILAIIVSNEIAAFTSSSIRHIPAGKALKNIIAIGFPGSTDQEVWTISTSLTLALLAGFQAAVFCFALFRITRSISHQRRTESRNSDKAHLIKGIGWMSGSMMLGAVETVLGFAVGGFGVVLTRRILRLLARASLCIGVAKGVPTGTRSRQSQLREIISNPRFSTFHQLSPKATFFHATHQASNMQEKSATYRTPETVGLPDMAHFANIRAQNGHQRVSIRYHRGRPLLHLRLSTFDMPSPETLVEEIKSRPQSEWNLSRPRPATRVEDIKSQSQSEWDLSRSQPATRVEDQPQSEWDLSPPRPNFHRPSKSVFRDSTDSTSSFYAPVELVSAPRRTLSQRSARAQLYQAVVPATSGESLYPDLTTAVEPRDLSRVQSMKSIPDSLQAVQDLAGQFPGPPMTFTHQNTFIISPPTPQALGSPSQLGFNGQPAREGKIVLSDGSEWSSNLSSPTAFSDNTSTRLSRRPTLYDVTGTPLRSTPLYIEKPLDPFNDDDEVDSLSPFRTPIVDNRMSSATAPRSRSVNSLQDSEAETGELATALNNGKSRQSKPRKLRSSRSMSRKDSPHSKDPRKSAPLPIYTSQAKKANLKHITIPPRRSSMPEIMDGSVDSDSSGGKRSLGRGRH